MVLAEWSALGCDIVMLADAGRCWLMMADDCLCWLIMGADDVVGVVCYGWLPMAVDVC